MKQRKQQWVFRELCWGITVVAVCLLLLILAAKNYRTIQMKFAELPYRIQGYPQGEVLLMGSSFMEYWKTSEADLGPVHTVNVGVAGTKVEHWRDHFSELVEPFHPRAIVIYAGSNDIDGSENSKSGQAVAEELEAFFEQIENALPGTPVYYISIAPTPKRWNVWDEAKTCNRLVEEMAQEREELSFIDCTQVLLDENGTPKADIFKSDKLHFSEKGYELWTDVIRPVILEDLGEETVKDEK